MKARALLLTLALFFAGATLSLAQSPLMGTWKLDEAKSKIPAGAPKNTNVVYESQGDSVKVTSDGTSGDGQQVHAEWTGKFDGKKYPVTGDPGLDARSYTKVNDHTLSMINTNKAGKVVSTGRIVVSSDGKTRTVSLSSTAPDGKKVSSTAIYDKQ